MDFSDNFPKMSNLLKKLAFTKVYILVSNNQGTLQYFFQAVNWTSNRLIITLALCADALKPVFIPWGLRKLFFPRLSINYPVLPCHLVLIALPYVLVLVTNQSLFWRFSSAKSFPKTCFCSQSQLSLAHTLNEVVSI